MAYQKIKLKLTSFDCALPRRAASSIIKTILSTGAKINGPIPLPTKKKRYTVLKSPHVNKKARDQYILMKHSLLLEISTSNPSTVDALMRLELPKGVEPEIKV